MCYAPLAVYVTGFKKTRLPHTQYQTYDFTRNGLLAQYTIIFHCWPCSKPTGLVSVAGFLRPCVSFEQHFGTIRWSWLSCIGAWRAGAGQCLLSSIWSAVSTKKVQQGAPNWTSGFQLSSYSILYSYIKPTLLSPPTTPITTTCNIITVTKKLLKTA